MIHYFYLIKTKFHKESKHERDYYRIPAAIPAEEALQPLSKSGCDRIKKSGRGD